MEQADFNKEKVIERNPFVKSGHIFDCEIVVITESNLSRKVNFNIRNTEFGLFLEVYASDAEDVFIVDKCFDLKEILSLIEEFYHFSFESAIKYLHYKFGFKEMYLFYDIENK